jgi:hypothetical protein
MAALVAVYFAQVHWHLPILHRPTFENALASLLHTRDSMFASTVLLVCAIASRYSDDPRVFMEGIPQSCGWKWFNQVRAVRRSLLSPPTLYELQFYCVSLSPITAQSCDNLHPFSSP